MKKGDVVTLCDTDKQEFIRARVEKISETVVDGDNIRVRIDFLALPATDSDYPYLEVK